MLELVNVAATSPHVMDLLLQDDQKIHSQFQAMAAFMASAQEESKRACPRFKELQALLHNMDVWSRQCREAPHVVKGHLRCPASIEAQKALAAENNNKKK